MVIHTPEMTVIREKGGVFFNCCPTGMVLTRDQSPHVPLSVNEIVTESLALTVKGASIIHIHARDDEGRPTWRKDVYKRIIGGIREKNRDIIICVSTSGRLWSDFARRSEVLELDGDYRPDMASLSPGSFNFLRSASLSEPALVEDLARKMADRGIKAECEIFDTGMLNTLAVLSRKKLIPPPFYINLIFGNIHTMQLHEGLVAYLLERVPSDALVAFGGIGSFQASTIELAISRGLGVRLGLEDNHFLDTGRKVPASNGRLLGKALRYANARGRDILAPGEVRERLELRVPSA